MFPQLSGPEHALISKMKDQIQRVYSTFVTQVHRRPNSAPSNLLPLLIAAADLPGGGSSNEIVSRNGGLHFHGLLLIPPSSRLRTSVSEHFGKNWDRYTGSGRLIERIHVKAVLCGYSRVTDYILKSIVKGRLTAGPSELVMTDLSHGSTSDDFCWSP